MYVLLKYVGNFFFFFKIPLINCEINLILTWSTYCVICKTDRSRAFAIADTKLYLSLGTLSTQDNTATITATIEMTIQ